MRREALEGGQTGGGSSGNGGKTGNVGNSGNGGKPGRDGSSGNGGKVANVRLKTPVAKKTPRLQTWSRTDLLM